MNMQNFSDFIFLVYFRLYFFVNPILHVIWETFFKLMVTDGVSLLVTAGVTEGSHGEGFLNHLATELRLCKMLVFLLIGWVMILKVFTFNNDNLHSAQL